VVRRVVSAAGPRVHVVKKNLPLPGFIEKNGATHESEDSEPGAIIERSTQHEPGDDNKS